MKSNFYTISMFSKIYLHKCWLSDPFQLLFLIFSSLDGECKIFTSKCTELIYFEKFVLLYRFWNLQKFLVLSDFGCSRESFFSKLLKLKNICVLFVFLCLDWPMCFQFLVQMNLGLSIVIAENLLQSLIGNCQNRFRTVHSRYFGLSKNKSLLL